MLKSGARGGKNGEKGRWEWAEKKENELLTAHHGNHPNAFTVTDK